MRALLLSVTAGQGHNMCAKAMEEALSARGVECTTLDTVKFINPPTGKLVDKGYLTMGKKVPKIWGAVYNSAVKFSEKGYGISPDSSALRMICHKLLEYIQVFQPDMIICTHVFASQMVTALRASSDIDIPVIGINTDFSLHPFWEDVDQNYLVLGCDKMYYSVVQRGIEQEKILPYGIPVRQRFNRRILPQQGRKEIGWEEKQTLCIMGGSMGFGNMHQDVLALDALPLDFQMVVICGSNLELYNQLVADRDYGRLSKTTYLYAFTDRVDDIMRASDAVCTKPGGLSTSETLAVGRPLVLLDPIPGLEEFNAWFLVNHGVAIRTGKQYPLNEAIFNLFHDERRMEEILRAQTLFFPNDSANTLANFIMDRFLTHSKKEEHYSLGEQF